MMDKIRAVYRALAPESVRASGPLRRMRAAAIRLGGFQWLYNEDYFRRVIDPTATRSAWVIARSVVERFHPSSVIDVGCGTGAILAAFRDLGCRTLGLEYARAALRVCRERQLQVLRFRIGADAWTSPDTFDLAVSTEVAEHLPADLAVIYVELLCRLAPQVLITAAHPGQGGTGHLNEQPPAYWKALFQRAGFACDEEASEALRRVWRESGQVSPWYHENAMVFRK